MVARWVVLAVGAGCASVPPDPGEQRLLEVDAATGRVSTTSRAPMQYTVEFGDHGVRMPQGIFIDGVNRVANGSCPTEAGVGVSVYPAFVAAAPANGGDDATGGLTVEWAGPVIARVVVTWNVAYTCVGAQQARGTSTFTMFPNGRIVRHDVATPSSTMLPSSMTDCGCSSDTAFFFTSFWTFNGANQSVTSQGTAWMDGETSGCAVYPNHTIGIAWPDTDTRLTNPGGVSAFVHDWANSAPTLPATERELVSAIMLSEQTTAANCDDVLADLADFPIMVAGSMVVTDDSGIYVDTRHHAGRVEISAPRRIPRGFAISLDVGGFAEVSRTPQLPGSWYATQRDGGRTVLWFRDGLGVGETIAIDPR